LLVTTFGVVFVVLSNKTITVITHFRSVA